MVHRLLMTSPDWTSIELLHSSTFFCFRHAIAGSSSATTSLIVAMHQYQSRLGYFLLHYLHTVGRSAACT